MPTVYFATLGGVLLLLTAGVWIWGNWRLRQRVASGPCPRCGGRRFYRCHRTLADHIFGLGVGVRRYRCETPDCGWEGLRKRAGR